MTELFVSTTAEAGAYGPATSKGFERAQLGGLTSLEFESLWSILANEEWDVTKHNLTPVRSSESDWTFEFPAAFRALIQGLRPEMVPPITMKWAATDELDGTEPIELAPVIAHLARIDASARNQDKGMFVWVTI